MTLTARKPDIASPDAALTWSPVPEFAHVNNGASVMIPYVEHYLNNVMAEVRDQHCDGNPALREEIDQFIRQEATHARYHLAFNKQMFEAGYEGLKPLIGQTVAELQQMRKTRSLAFNVAYCAGFETTATFSAKYLLGHCDRYLAGADSYGANLFQWHVAEEFEHRGTCHKALAAVTGGGVRGYVTRIAGLAYSFWHIGRMFDRAAGVVFTRYRAAMTEEQRRASIREQKRVTRRQLMYLIPGLLRLLNPFYDPERLKVPRNIQIALDYFKTREPIGASFADVREDYFAAAPAPQTAS